MNEKLPSQFNGGNDGCSVAIAWARARLLPPTGSCTASTSLLHEGLPNLSTWEEGEDKEQHCIFISYQLWCKEENDLLFPHTKALLNCRNVYANLYSCHTGTFLQKQGCSVALTLYLRSSHSKSILHRQLQAEWGLLNWMQSRWPMCSPRVIPRSFHLPVTSITALYTSLRSSSSAGGSRHSWQLDSLTITDH